MVFFSTGKFEAVAAKFTRLCNFIFEHILNVHIADHKTTLNSFYVVKLVH